MHALGIWAALGFVLVAFGAPSGPSNGDGLTAAEVLRLEAAAATLASGEAPLPTGCNNCWDAFNHNVGFAHAFSGTQPLTPPGYYIVTSFYLFVEPFDEEAEHGGIPQGHSNWVSGRCLWYHETCFPSGDFEDALAALVAENDPTDLRAMMAANPGKVLLSDVAGFIMFGCNGATGMVQVPMDAWVSLASE